MWLPNAAGVQPPNLLPQYPELSAYRGQNCQSQSGNPPQGSAYPLEYNMIPGSKLNS